MTLKPAALAPLLLETASTAKPPAFSGLAVSNATPELLDPIVRLLRLLDRPDDLRVLAPGLEREILWRLVTGDQGALVRQIGLANSSLAHISRAIRYIREHYNEPVLIADLAELSGMSPSSFHRHFRAATSMTPDPVPEADPLAGGPRAAHDPAGKRGGDRLSRWLREPVAVQPRVPEDVRYTTGPRHLRLKVSR